MDETKNIRGYDIQNQRWGWPPWVAMLAAAICLGNGALQWHLGFSRGVAAGTVITRKDAIVLGLAAGNPEGEAGKDFFWLQKLPLGP